MKRTRILMASDIHLCHLDWFGTPNAVRVQKFIDDVKREYESDPFAALLLLGDYSLDHWKWSIGGSYLREGLSNSAAFAEKYLSQLRDLPIDIRMIPGNHEQYGDELWNRLTGHHRQETYLCGDYLFVMIDSYAKDLDPASHSDGTYSGTELALPFLRRAMEEYPDQKIIICSHYLEPWKESTEFQSLLRDEERVVCLFAGHIHKSDIWTLEECGGKKQFFVGHFGESGYKEDPEKCMWGFREVILSDGSLETNYITPASTYLWNEKECFHPAGKQDGAILTV